MSDVFGPQNPDCDRVHAQKYRQKGETFKEAMTRVASALADSEPHFQSFRSILLHQRFLPAGRIQSCVGAPRATTPYNCFVSGPIEDSYTRGHGSIMARAAEAAETMRLGGGIGYDFSPIRPLGDIIRTLESLASGPVSFMHIYDAVGRVTASTDQRRGAQMGVLRVDHPDIELFVRAKQNNTALTGFNISVAVTNEFMEAVLLDSDFPLRFGGRVYKAVRAQYLWDLIMRTNYDWSEPGVLFIDTINKMNNLRYCETIAATNPCGEQPLPPYGACLLGSINLTKLLKPILPLGTWEFNYRQLIADIPYIIRAMDNVVDLARYPLFEQEKEAKSKRRMGIGITGTANAIEALGHPYGSEAFVTTLKSILRTIANTAYMASVKLAQEKGAFPAFQKSPYLSSRFVRHLPDTVQEEMAIYGIRNSHLLSIAPTGTISLCADNISSGIEPVFALTTQRTIQTFEGPRVVTIEDFGAKYLRIKGKTAEECTANDHLEVLKACAPFIDSAVSKTCNVPNNISWESFKDIYVEAWKAGCKGCTTHRTGNGRGAILVSQDEPAPAACEINPSTGVRNCE